MSGASQTGVELTRNKFSDTRLSNSEMIVTKSMICTLGYKFYHQSHS